MFVRPGLSFPPIFRKTCQLEARDIAEKGNMEQGLRVVLSKNR